LEIIERREWKFGARILDFLFLFYESGCFGGKENGNLETNSSITSLERGGSWM
jgi:hypothetical protein